MAKMKGLGKGLDALLGDDFTNEPEVKSSLFLPISQVESCAAQPRKQFDPDALADLADSIRQHGIIQPLTVRKLQSGYYQIIAGERRWRAARMAGLSQVPVVVIEADDRKAMELAMIENLQREDLNPMEEAEGYQALIQQYNLTQEETAQRVGSAFGDRPSMPGYRPGKPGEQGFSGGQERGDVPKGGFGGAPQGGFGPAPAAPSSQSE